MIPDPKYSLSKALMPDGVTERFVIVGDDDRVHISSSWLLFMADTGRSPNTIRNYGARLAWYLSWTALTTDWRAVTLSHLALWRRAVEISPVRKTNGQSSMRTAKTVGLWMVPLRSFYEWADAEGLLATDVASRMTQMKYFAPGTAAGGEHGRRRRVLTEVLRPAGTSVEAPPEWIDDADARQRLETLTLPTRDRFLIDLMYRTGIRAGEALSLFTADLHFGGGSRALGCRHVDPHFHVRVDNAVENTARAKGQPRLLFVDEDLVEGYIDYLLERGRFLGSNDKSAHVFVNMYSHDESRGRAMTYSGVKKLIARCAKRINFDLTGPHMLRHTLATRLVRGIDCEAQDLDVVQAILGHASIDSTRIYTHDLESAKKAALNSLAVRTVTLAHE